MVVTSYLYAVRVDPAMVVKFATETVHVMNSVVTLGSGSAPKTSARGERRPAGGRATPSRTVTVTVVVSVLVRVAGSDTVIVDVPATTVSGTGKAVPVVMSTVTMTVTVDTARAVTSALAGALVGVSNFRLWPIYTTSWQVNID